MNYIFDNFILILISIIVVILLLIISKKFFKYFFILAVGSLVFIFLNGCSGGNLNMTNTMENIEENTLTRIQDIPFVKNSRINIEKSLIMGEGKSWSGQLSIRVPEPKPEVFNFYVRNIGEFGWKEQTTIRGETSILNFVGDNNRVAIITISDIAFNKTRVLITVAPYTEEFQEKIGDYINEKYLELKKE